MREKIDTKNQQEYWDTLSDEYHEITSIVRDDFHYGPQIPGERELKLLPKFEAGTTALELGCGAAQNSIWLAMQGVVCTAMDISDQQLKHARAIADEEGVSIRLMQAPLETFRDGIGDETFDFVHSSHAMEFPENPEAVIREMATAVKMGGLLMISTVHPLYNGEWIEGAAEADDEEFVDGDGLFLTSYFEPPDDVRDDEHGYVVSRAYPVSSWFKWLRTAGFEVIAIEEPAAIVDAPYSSEDWANHGGMLDAIPSTIIFVAKKVG